MSDQQGDKIFKCQRCNYEAFSVQHLVRHVKRVHKLSGAAAREQGYIDSKVEIMRTGICLPEQEVEQNKCVSDR